MKSGKKFSKALLTLAVLALALCTFFACSGGVTVEFNSDGGTSVPSVTLNAGEVLAAPEIPTREGYSFAGWVSENGEAWNFTAPVNNSMVLTASWVKNSSANTATVSFDLKGGDPTSFASSVTVQKGAILEEPKAPVRHGYDFAGWFYLGEKFDFATGVIAGDITLVAKWDVAVFNIDYELSGGKLEAPITEYTTTEEVKISAPTRDGYEFLGWTYEGASAPVKDLVLSVGSYGDLELTATWQAKEYGVSYELSGALLPEDVILTESYNAESESFTAPALTKEFYDFLGWQVNGKGEPQLDFTVEKGSFGELSLVAVFKPTEYKINYTLGEGATNNAANPLYTTVESLEFTLLAPTLKGYKLVGWQIGGEGEVLTEAVIPAGATEELSFTAVWEKASYTVTYFDGNGKAHEGESLPLSFTMDNLPVKLPTLYLNNKCFISWYADADFKTPITEITECADTCVYARFEDVTDGLSFSFNGESYELVSYTGASSVVYVPEFYKGIRVTSIASGAFEGASLSEIYLPESIKTIGERAFFSAKNLKKINLHDGAKLERIEKNAFSGSGLESFTATEALNYLGEGVFMGCASLKTVSLEKASISALYASSFEGTSLGSLALPASVEYIYAKAFYNAASIKSVSFAEGSKLSAIYESAFKNCLALEAIALPKSLVSIKESAFENCSALKSVSFAEGSELNFIGASAFRACYLLEAIALPEKLITVSDFAFYLDYALASVTFSENAKLTSIGKSAFSYTAISELILPENLLTISESAFAFATKLEKVDFNEKLALIEKLAFNGCSKLLAIELASGTNAEEDSFLGCDAVLELVINKVDPTAIFGGALPVQIERVTLLNKNAIKEGIFEGCVALEYVKLPFVGVVNYGAAIYKDCTNHVAATASDKNCKNCGLCIAHSDTDENGICDACGICTNHKTDADLDGNCDACLSCLNHVDYDLDGICENCGERFKFMPAKADGSDVKTFVALFGESVPSSLKTVEITGGSYVAEYAFKDCASIETVILPLTTETVGRGAFNGCTSLSYISLPLYMTGDKGVDYAEVTYEKISELDGEVIKETVTELVPTKTLSYIFDFNVPASLREVVLFAGEGEKQRELAPRAFVGSSVRKVTLNGFNSISDEAFLDVKTITTLDISNSVITKIGDFAFAGSAGIKAVEIPATVKSIGIGAFANSSVEYVAFAKGSELSEIGEGAFMGCKALYRVSLPEGITKVPAYLFADCTALTEFALPDSVVAIGEGAFFGCELLKDVVIGEESELSEIGAYAFSETGIESFTFPLSVSVISEGLFENCALLTSVKFALPEEDAEYEGMLAVSDYAFMNSGLKSIRLPYYTVAVGISAFEGCEALESVSFGADSMLFYIGERAFAECDSLAAVKIPKSVISIENECFKECRSLKNISFSEENELQYIGESAFENCLALEAIEIPRSVSFISVSAFANCFSLKDLKFALSETVPAEEEGAEPSVIPASLAVIADGAFKNCDSLVSVTLPNSLIYLGESAFYSCDKLEGVEFEEGIALDVIAPNTFLNCVSLKSFNAPDSLTLISESAFMGCSLLETVSFGENSELYAIDSYAFMNCAALKSFKAPASLVYIGAEAFKGCLAFESLEITTGVLVIENYAFDNTPKLVITVTYFEEGAHIEWLNSPSLGAYWNSNGNEIKFVLASVE